MLVMAQQVDSCPWAAMAYQRAVCLEGSLMGCGDATAKTRISTLRPGPLLA